MTEQLQLRCGIAPPFQVVPETSRRIIRTSMIALALPACAALMFFGWRALVLMFVGTTSALLCDCIIRKRRQRTVHGTTTHSAMMGLLTAFMLPANAPWYIAVFAAAAAVLLGKYLWGGMGRYAWHPAVVGRLLVQLIFPDTLCGDCGPLLSKAHAFTADINAKTQTLSSPDLHWLQTLTDSDHVGFWLEKPLTAFRNFGQINFLDNKPQIADYIYGHFPPIFESIIGAVPGGLGESSAIMLLLVGVFMVYRGYLKWRMPAAYILAAAITAALLPILCKADDQTFKIILWPLWAEDALTGLTYVNIHILNGGILLTACLLFVDMTARPLHPRGQIYFAAGAGALTIVLRLYTKIPTPEYAALFIIGSLLPLIDRTIRAGR